MSQIVVDRTQSEAVYATNGAVNITVEPPGKVFKRVGIKMRIGLRHPKLVTLDIAEKLGIPQDIADALHNRIVAAAPEHMMSVCIEIVSELMTHHNGPIPDEVTELLKELITEPHDQVEWLVADIKGVRVYIHGNSVIITERDLYP